MPMSPLSLVIQHLRADLRPDCDGMTDGELLSRFVNSRDEDALAALVRRHASMVWGVCRRLLNHHDAEDAFQATFLVLVRKGAGVPRGAVPNWLHGVARQTAVRVRATTVKRGLREAQAVGPPEPAIPEVRDTELQTVVDEELSRLPNHYRIVVILCDLEGITRKEAARQLGIPEGSVASRLARARALLAKRLNQRVVVFSGSVATVFSAGSASASAPPALVASTIKAASLLTAGQAAGVVSAKVADLTDGAVKAMIVSKLKAAFSAVLILGVLATGATLLTYRAATGQENKGKKAEAVPPRKEGEEPKVKDEDAIQGTWVVMKIKGVDKEAEDPKGDMKLAFKGDTMTILVSGEPQGNAKFTLDSAKKPKRIHTSAERFGAKVTVPGIYKLDGDDLTIGSGDGATEPPASFDLKDAKPNVSFMTLRREKSDKAKDKKPNAEKSKAAEAEEPFTAWGTEASGLQAGLGYEPGEKRIRLPGETVKLVVRVRNVGKEEVSFQHLRHFFIENPPTVTDDKGKAVALKDGSPRGIYKPEDVILAPGKEIDLYKLSLTLSDKATDPPHDSTLYGDGKFQLQYERILGDSLLSSVSIRTAPALRTLATGKLDLVVNRWLHLTGTGVDLLQGEWGVTEWQEEGENASGDELKGKNVVIKGNVMSGVQPGIGGSMSFRLNPEKTPNEIDLTSLDGKRKGITEPGIYKIESDRLRICFGGKARPKEFATTPGSGRTLLTLQKEPLTAWGKVAGGLQAGLSISNASDVRLGGKATVVLRLRNVSNDPITASAWPLWLIKPTIVDGTGKQVRTTSPSSPGFDLSTTDITLKPGQTVVVATNNIFVVDADAKDRVRHEGVADQFTIHVRQGKHSVHLKGFLESRPTVATGTVDFEVKADILDKYTPWWGKSTSNEVVDPKTFKAELPMTKGEK